MDADGTVHGKGQGGLVSACFSALFLCRITNATGSISVKEYEEPS